MTYNSLPHLIYLCSLRRRRTSSSCARTLRSRNGTRPRGSGVSGAPSCDCSAPWTRPTCPYSLGRRHSSTGQGCTQSCCSGTRSGRSWAPSIFPHHWHLHSHYPRHRQKWVPDTFRYDTGSLRKGRPWHLEKGMDMLI